MISTCMCVQSNITELPDGLDLQFTPNIGDMFITHVCPESFMHQTCICNCISVQHVHMSTLYFPHPMIGTWPVG